MLLLIAVALIVLKLAHIIAWPWLAVLVPIIAIVAIYSVIALVFGAAAFTIKKSIRRW